MITPSANTEMINLHLAEISTQVTPGARAVMLCDGAGWHRPGEQLQIPANIILLPLPSYAPELKPMENIWDYLHQNKLCATVWETYEEIIEACKTAWNWLLADHTESTQSALETGHVSVFRRVGIRCRFGSPFLRRPVR